MSHAARACRRSVGMPVPRCIISVHRGLRATGNHAPVVPETQTLETRASPRSNPSGVCRGGSVRGLSPGASGRPDAPQAPWLCSRLLVQQPLAYTCEHLPLSQVTVPRRPLGPPPARGHTFLAASSFALPNVRPREGCGERREAGGLALQAASGPSAPTGRPEKRAQLLGDARFHEADGQTFLAASSPDRR